MWVEQTKLKSRPFSHPPFHIYEIIPPPNTKLEIYRIFFHVIQRFAFPKKKMADGLGNWVTWCQELVIPVRWPGWDEVPHLDSHTDCKLTSLSPALSRDMCWCAGLTPCTWPLSLHGATALPSFIPYLSIANLTRKLYSFPQDIYNKIQSLIFPLLFPGK